MPLPLPSSLDQLGDPMQLPRTDHQIHKRHPIENLLLILLRHAAHDPNDHIGIC